MSEEKQTQIKIKQWLSTLFQKPGALRWKTHTHTKDERCYDACFMKQWTKIHKISLHNKEIISS